LRDRILSREELTVSGGLVRGFNHLRIGRALEGRSGADCVGPRGTTVVLRGRRRRSV